MSALSPERLARIDAVLDARTRRTVLVLDNLHDEHNMSAVVRSTEAFGIQELHAIESRQYFAPNRRVTQGCEKWLTLVRHESAADCFAALRARGYLLCGADPTPDAVPITALDFARPIALVFGGEHDGLRPDTRALLEQRFVIPMRGFTRSINVSTAVAVSLFYANVRREQLGGADGLDPADRVTLRADWLTK